MKVGEACEVFEKQKVELAASYPRAPLACYTLYWLSLPLGRNCLELNRALNKWMLILS